MINSTARAATRICVVVGIAAGIVVGAQHAPQPIAVRTTAPPAVGSQEVGSALVERVAMVCPGPEQQGLADAAVAEVDQSVEVEAMAAPSEAVEAALATKDYGGIWPDQSTGSITLSPLSGSGSATEASATTNERGVAARSFLSGPQGIAALAFGALAPGASTTQLFIGDGVEHLGLALTPCAQASEESWLIAGGGERGRAERLVLINPGQSPIAVSTQVWGSTQDPVGEVGDTGISLAPGERQVLLVDALAPSEKAPVVHVVATGGPVSAYLGDRELQGTTEVGMELTGPVAGSSTRHLIPSVDLPAGQARSASIRVAVPGVNSAVVEIAAWGTEGVVPVAQDVTLVAGQRSADIALTDLPPGTYALHVSSDEEIVASAVVSSQANDQGQRDRSWAASVPAVTTLAGAPLPQAGRGAPVDYSLTLVAPEGGSATVFAITKSGDLTSAEVDLDAAIVNTSDLGDAAGVWVVPGEGEIFASVHGSSAVLSRAGAGETPESEEAAPAAGSEDDADSTAQSIAGDEGAVTVTSVVGLPNLQVVRPLSTVRPALP